MALCVSSYTSWQRTTMVFFTASCYLCTFLPLVLQAGDPSLGFRPHFSQGYPTNCLIIPLALLPMGVQPAFLSLHHTPYQSIIVEIILMSCRGYKSSLSLLFSYLFQVISPQFGYNSRLVLGGGQCDSHPLFHHFASPQGWIYLGLQTLTTASVIRNFCMLSLFFLFTKACNMREKYLSLHVLFNYIIDRVSNNKCQAQITKVNCRKFFIVQLQRFIHLLNRYRLYSQNELITS